MIIASFKSINNRLKSAEVIRPIKSTNVGNSSHFMTNEALVPSGRESYNYYSKAQIISYLGILLENAHNKEIIVSSKITDPQ